MAVAYSGGRDSTALLHAVASQIRANDLGDVQAVEVVALHVHHGLSAHADAWRAHCERQCAAWAAAGLPVRLRVHHLDGRPAPGESIEAWAREHRHAALAAMAREAGASLLLFAHHRRDQAETLLLQGLRGAGVAGLAGMPRLQRREGLIWARPWLDRPREAIEAYLAAHELSYVDDDSNAATRFARNRLRREVWPALTAAFPQAEASLARAADWAQQALDLQREIAGDDLARCATEAGLDLAALADLSAARCSNALRAWIEMASGQGATATLIERLLAEAPLARQGRWPHAQGWLRLYRNRLTWGAEPFAAREGPSRIVNLGFAGEHAQADWGGCWVVELVESGGVAPALLQDLTLRARSGGEQFQRAPKSLPRGLKKAYQEAGVPAWQRRGPLLLAGDRLLFVPGLGIDARMLAAPGELQLSLVWRPDPKPV